MWDTHQVASGWQKKSGGYKSIHTYTYTYTYTYIHTYIHTYITRQARNIHDVSDLVNDVRYTPSREWMSEEEWGILQGRAQLPGNNFTKDEVHAQYERQVCNVCIHTYGFVCVCTISPMMKYERLVCIVCIHTYGCMCVNVHLYMHMCVWESGWSYMSEHSCEIISRALFPGHYVPGIMSRTLCPGNYFPGIMSRVLCPGHYVPGIMSREIISRWSYTGEHSAAAKLFPGHYLPGNNFTKRSCLENNFMNMCVRVSCIHIYV
jgi:hypothetical protein